MQTEHLILLQLPFAANKIIASVFYMIARLFPRFQYFIFSYVVGITIMFVRLVHCKQ